MTKLERLEYNLNAARVVCDNAFDALVDANFIYNDAKAAYEEEKEKHNEK